VCHCCTPYDHIAISTFDNDVCRIWMTRDKDDKQVSDLMDAKVISSYIANKSQDLDEVFWHIHRKLFAINIDDLYLATYGIKPLTPTAAI
jgi:hypothetical protein